MSRMNSAWKIVRRADIDRDEQQRRRHQHEPQQHHAIQHRILPAPRSKMSIDPATIFSTPRSLRLASRMIQASAQLGERAR
jgi:hypothetical protein